MTTWFAQNSSVNIDSVNQWNSAANGSGSWLTWASLAVGDILVANGKTAIAINTDFTCDYITTEPTGGTTGGGFTCSTTRTVAATIRAGSTTCVSLTAGTLTVTGNVVNATTAVLAHGVSVSGTANLTVTGYVIGGSNAGGFANAGISFNSTGILSVTGNVTGGSGMQSSGILVSAQASVTIVGNVTGGTGTTNNLTNNSVGIRITGAASVAITGDVIGGQNNSQYGIMNDSSAAIITLTGDLCSRTAAAYISTIDGAKLLHVGNTISDSVGHSIFGGGLYLIDGSGTRTHTYRINTGGIAGIARTLSTAGSNQAATADVRFGTSYGGGTGSLRVPDPSYVATGVLTDNTTGTYAGSLNAADVRAAIGLASANLDTQLSGIQSDSNDIQSRLPAALESGRIAAALDSATSQQITDIKAKTDNLPASPAAIGSEMTLTVAYDAAKTAASQTSVNDLPTNSELATALAAADDAVLSAIAALNNLSAAQVNAELLDVLSVDTFGELSSPPAATSSLKDKLVYLFMWARNKATETSTQRKLFADDGTTVVSTETVGDDGTTFTKGEAS